MSRIPKDLDDTIWLIVKSGDPKAAEEFLHRFPNLRDELYRRRGHQKPQSEDVPKKVFPSWIVIMELVVLFVGFLIYKLTLGAMPSPQKAPELVPVFTTTAPADTSPAPDPEPTPTVHQPPKQYVEFDQVPLHTVLQAIGAQFNLKIEIAPGLPNPNVTVHCQASTGMEFLKQIGDQFQFTPFEQGSGEVLVVPATPKSP